METLKKILEYVKAAYAWVWPADSQWRKYAACIVGGVLLGLFLTQCAFAVMPTENPPPIPSNSSAEAAATSTSRAVASNEGNTLVVTEARQAPSVAQGSLYLVGCGFSGNAGDSGPKGASFLGVQFITPGCWDQLMIQTEAAMGNIKTACELNRLTRAGKRNIARLKAAGVAVEPCPDQIARPDAPPAVTGGEKGALQDDRRFTVAEANERCERQAKVCNAGK